MLKLFRNFRYIFLMTILGCDVVGSVKDIAPFPDRPTEIYSFQYTTVRASGVVWAFNRDGSPVIFGGPIGLIYENELLSAISISGTGIDLLTTSDVANTNPEQINAFASAAATFCVSEGYTVSETGSVNIYTDQGELFLIGYCAPDA